MRRLFTVLLGLLLTVVPATTPLVTARSAPPPRPVAFAATRTNTRATGGPPVRAFAPTTDPAAGLAALTVTPQAGLGELRYYTLERQRLSDRMDLAVNVANGNLVVHAHDLQVRGTGLDLVVDRFYNNLTQNAAEFGVAPWIMGTGRDVGL